MAIAAAAMRPDLDGHRRRGARGHQQVGTGTSGHLFIFFSKRCDRVRIVYWDRNGLAMWTKRLEKGRFHPTFSSDGRLSSVGIEAAELALIVEGIELAGARRRPRWQPASALAR